MQGINAKFCYILRQPQNNNYLQNDYTFKA